jgi:hypothetical protein
MIEVEECEMSLSSRKLWVLVLVMFLGISVLSAIGSPDMLPKAEAATFADPELNAAVHKGIYVDLDALVIFGVDGYNRSISNLSGIEALTNLSMLSLGDNQISDISALSGLTKLQSLSLDYNKIRDISALSGLTSLQVLTLGDNQISDISALSGLINLTDLNLIDNQISDISALSGLTNLHVLDLWNNNIDITPGSDDMQIINTLIGRGVAVSYRPQKTTSKPTPAYITAIPVYMDGTLLKLDVPPRLENGRTLVPVRAIFEALGATVSYNAATQTVTAVKGETVIVLSINKTETKVNNIIKKLDVPAKIVSGRTLVPIRFVSEALGAIVTWEDSTKTIYIVSQRANPSSRGSNSKSNW